MPYLFCVKLFGISSFLPLPVPASCREGFPSSLHRKRWRVIRATISPQMQAAKATARFKTKKSSRWTWKWKSYGFTYNLQKAQKTTWRVWLLLLHVKSNWMSFFFKIQRHEANSLHPLLICKLPWKDKAHKGQHSLQHFIFILLAEDKNV